MFRTWTGAKFTVRQLGTPFLLAVVLIILSHPKRKSGDITTVRLLQETRPQD